MFKSDDVSLFVVQLNDVFLFHVVFQIHVCMSTFPLLNREHLRKGLLGGALFGPAAGIQKALQDTHGRQLVHHQLALVPAHVGLEQRPLGKGSRQALVKRAHLPAASAKQVDKGEDFLCLRADLTAH